MLDAEDPGAEPRAIDNRDLIPLDRPWIWLEHGWRDFIQVPGIGLTFGGGLVLASWGIVLLVAIAGHVHLLLPLTGGFFIVAPVLVAGLYDTSRRIEQGHHTSVWTALFGWRAAGQIALMGMVLLLIHLVWIRIALFLYPLFMLGATPGWNDLPAVILGATAGLIVGTGIGAVLALVAFSLSVISIPMLVDRDVSVIEAIVTSLRIVRRSPRVMLLWGSIIVVATALGIATFFVGLAIVAPVLAHASWHAYRDAIAFDEGSPAPPEVPNQAA